ncbi:MAG: hypothetical protein ACOYBJ_02865 [Patescibacteria group bacterium]
MAATPGVLSVYQIGSVGAPGLSDLDFIVVLDEDQPPSAMALERERAGERDRYILFHEPFIMTPQSFSHLAAVTPTFSLVHRWGEQLTLVDRSPEELQMLKEVLLLDLCTVSLSHEFSTLQAQKVLDARLTIARLHALKYPITLLEAVDEPVPQDWQKYVDRVAALRRDWFAMDLPAQRAAIAALVVKAMQIAPALTEGIVRSRRTSARWRCAGVRATFVGEGVKLITPGTVWPVQSACQLAYYAQQEGPVSAHVRRFLRIHGDWELADSRYRTLLQERIRVLNALSSFRQNHAYAFGGLFTFGHVIGWGLLPLLLRIRPWVCRILPSRVS